MNLKKFRCLAYNLLLFQTKSRGAALCSIDISENHQIILIAGSNTFDGNQLQKKTKAKLSVFGPFDLSIFSAKFFQQDSSHKVLPRKDEKFAKDQLKTFPRVGHL